MSKYRFTYTIIVTIIFSFFDGLYGQSYIVPEGTFRSPVDYDYTLSGSFNELRESHFHTGIDIKPSRVATKDRIYSIGNGYVSRIKIAAGGYGYALYIDHPETGFTSVYAHLESYSAKISQVAKNAQIRQGSFEVDLALTKEDLPLSKGEIIGIMGNSGFSFGEHLHFEIRDTKTEKPINPLLFGFHVTDNIPPTISNLAIHGLDDNFHKIYELVLPTGTAEDGKIYVPDSIEIPAQKIGIALETFDKANASNNKLGLYGLQLFVDNELQYSYFMDKISFTQNKLITGFYDFEEKKKSGDVYSLCYKLPGNDVEFLKNTGHGIIFISPDKVTNIRVEAEDYFKNKKTIIFDVKRAQTIIETPPAEPFTRWIRFGQSTEILDNNIKIKIGSNALYRTIPFKLDIKRTSGKNSTYQIHQETEALRTNIELHIKPEVYVEKYVNKSIITYTNKKGRKFNCGGSWREGFLMAHIGEFGMYSVGYDTIPPTIKTINFKKITNKRTKFLFSIRDNLPTKGRDVSELTYKVWIDGMVTISPYSLKSSELEVPVSHLSSGTHTLKIEVKDHSGNKRVFESEFNKNTK